MGGPRSKVSKLLETSSTILKADVNAIDLRTLKIVERNHKGAAIDILADSL